MTPAASLTVDQERQRRLAGTLSMFGMSAVQYGLAALAQLILFAVAARQLAPAEFGKFTAFATLAVWFTLSDVGLNKALLASLGRASEPRRLTATALLLQAGIAGTLFTIAMFLLPPYLRLPGLLALAVAPLSVARALQASRQNGWVPAAWDLAGSAAMIALSLIASAQSGLGGLTLIAASGLLVSRLLGGLWLLRERDPEPWRPSWPLAQQLWQDGRHFLVAQLADLLLLQGLPWVAMLSLAESEAGSFSAAAKLAGFLPMAMGLYANALLPAYADAWARDDVFWIRRTLMRSSTVAFALASGVVLVLILIVPGLLQFWLSERVPALSGSAWRWLAIWAGLQTAIVPLLAFFYGTGRVRWIAHWNLAAALTGLSAGALAAQTAGAAGLAAAVAGAYLILLGLPVVLRARELFEWQRR